MDEAKLERIMGKLGDVRPPTMNDFVAMEEVAGPISADNGGAPRVKFSQLRFLAARVISKLGDPVTPEEIGDLPVDHPIFTKAMAKAQESGIPTGAAGG